MPLPISETMDPSSIERAVPGGTITLDIAGDAYFCRCAPDSASGFLANTRDHGRALPPGDPKLDPKAVLSLLLALVRTLFDMRRCAFADLLRLTEHRMDRLLPTPFDASRYGRAVAQFERFCLYVPFRFRCLFRAYWLLRFLAQRGLRAQWVFGGALFPFEAHCWVACHGHLLGEHPHRLEGLFLLHTVPIMEA